MDDIPEKTVKDHLSAKGTWMRLVFMLLFAVIFNIVEFVIFVIAVVQFLYKLVTGAANEAIRSLGGSLGLYIGEITAYLAFHTDARPYPWAEWPSAEETPAPAAKPAARRASRTTKEGGAGKGKGASGAPPVK